MPIKLIQPINVGRLGRSPGYRSLSEIRLDLVELKSLVEGIGRQVGDMRRELAATQIKVKARGRSKQRGDASPKVDIKRIANHMSAFQDMDEALDRINAIRAGLSSSGMRTRAHKDVEDDSEALERKLRGYRDKALGYLHKVAKDHAPKRFKEFTSEVSEALHERMDGQYEESRESTLVDVTDGGKLRFTHYIILDGVEFEGSGGYRHGEIAIPLTYDTERKGWFAAVLMRLRHPGRFEYGANVADAEGALTAITSKLRAIGFMGTLLDDDVAPFDPKMIRGKSFPGVTDIMLDDDDAVLTFKIRKGIEPRSVLKALRAGVHSLIRTTHPGHLLTHDIGKRAVSFRVDKDVPYMADRRAIDNMAEELGLTSKQRDSLRDWFVENMTNELPDPEPDPVPNDDGDDEPVREGDLLFRFGPVEEEKGREIVEVFVDSKSIGRMRRTPGRNWTSDGKDKWGRPSPLLPKSTRLGKALPDAKARMIELVSKRAEKDADPKPGDPKPGAEPDPVETKAVNPKPRTASRVDFSALDRSAPGLEVVHFRVHGARAGMLSRDEDDRRWRVSIYEDADDDARADDIRHLHGSFISGSLKAAKEALADQIDAALGEEASTSIRTVTAAIDTISGDGPPMIKGREQAVRRPHQRSVNRTLERIASHFEGDSLPVSDPLHGIAKAIPGVDVDSRIVLLTQPHSVFVEHSILLGKKGDKVLVDRNPFLHFKWKPSASFAHAKDPSQAGEYRAMLVDGTKRTYRPRKIMTVGQFIKESGTRFKVRSMQLVKRKEAPSPKGSPKPAKRRPEAREEETAEYMDEVNKRLVGLLAWPKYRDIPEIVRLWADEPRHVRGDAKLLGALKSFWRESELESRPDSIYRGLSVGRRELEGLVRRGSMRLRTAKAESWSTDPAIAHEFALTNAGHGQAALIMSRPRPKPGSVIWDFEEAISSIDIHSDPSSEALEALHEASMTYRECELVLEQQCASCSLADVEMATIPFKSIQFFDDLLPDLLYGERGAMSYYDIRSGIDKVTEATSPQEHHRALEEWDWRNEPSAIGDCAAAEEARAPKRKGGILPWMISDGGLKVLVLKPGGIKGAGAGKWSIAKGNANKGESLLAAAKREFYEETGLGLPRGVRLSQLKDSPRFPGLSVWAVSGAKVPGASDVARMRSAKVSVRGKSIPEIAEHRWATIKQARRLLDPRQRPWLKGIEELAR